MTSQGRLLSAVDRNSSAVSVKTRSCDCTALLAVQELTLEPVFWAVWYGYNLSWLLIRRPGDDKEDRASQTPRWVESHMEEIYHYIKIKKTLSGGKEESQETSFCPQ